MLNRLAIYVLKTMRFLLGLLKRKYFLRSYVQNFNSHFKVSGSKIRKEQIASMKINVLNMDMHNEVKS